jgi:molecular chaperone DnaK
MIYAAEKAIREFGDKAPSDIRSEIEAKITDVRSVLKGEDAVKIKTATEALGQSVQKIGASVYEQGKSEGGSESASNPDADTEVVDGEVKE